VAAATEDTPVAEGEDFDGVRSVEKIEAGHVMSHATIQCDDGLGWEYPRRDDVEGWKKRGAPSLRSTVTETRVMLTRGYCTRKAGAGRMSRGFPVTAIREHSKGERIELSQISRYSRSRARGPCNGF